MTIQVSYFEDLIEKSNYRLEPLNRGSSPAKSVVYPPSEESFPLNLLSQIRGSYLDCWSSDKGSQFIDFGETTALSDRGGCIDQELLSSLFHSVDSLLTS